MDGCGEEQQPETLPGGVQAVFQVGFSREACSYSVISHVHYLEWRPLYSAVWSEDSVGSGEAGNATTLWKFCHIRMQVLNGLFQMEQAKDPTIESSYYLREM